MGRSVNYLTGAEYVIYFKADWINEEYEDGEYNEDLSSMNWDEFMVNLKSSICHKLKSYYNCEEWDNNETKIFLKNELAEIGISEYCGLYSLSVRAREDEFSYNADNIKEGLSKHHVEQIRNTLEKCLKDSGGELLNRVGTLSNGCGVFKKNKGYYENADRVI